jgi:hypothetical protein
MSERAAVDDKVGGSRFNGAEEEREKRKEE